MQAKSTISLVTGGAGFIGSNIVEGLVERGRSVRVVDNLSTGSIANLKPFTGSIEFVEGDLSDLDTAKSVCEGVDVIYHLAALPGVPQSMQTPSETTQHNVMAMVNVLEAARDASVRRVILSSSSSVYGGDGPFPQHEDAPARLRHPYATAKYCCELYCRTFAEVFDIDAVSLRYFNIFGPRQTEKSRYAAVFPAFISRMIKGEPATIYGDGKTTRDFTYVSNVVNANILAADREANFDGAVMNIGAGQRTSLLELVAKINTVLGTDLKPLHEDERLGDVKDSLADISRAKEMLGYVPEVDVSAGLKHTVEYFRSLG